MNLLVGLGGNTGDVRRAFAAAAGALAGRFHLAAASSLWRTQAVGPPQPAYLNAAVLLDVDVHPLQVLAVCLGLEAAAGRHRGAESRWSPRPLDLDLLAAAGIVCSAPALELPHPRLAVRRFALLPAAELAPGWVHPRLHRTLADLAAALDPREQPCVSIGRLNF